MCYGSGCKANFTNCTFKHCCIVVLSGANVTVNNCIFENRTDASQGIGIYACGSGTIVHVAEVDITGGAQGVAVHGGACMYGSKLTISRCFVTGVETKDESSSVDLSDCIISDFSRAYTSCVGAVCMGTNPLSGFSNPSHAVHDVTVRIPENSKGFLSQVHGVLVQCGSCATLTGVEVQGVETGVVVCSGAEAKLSGCVVRDTMQQGFDVRSGAKVQLRECVAVGVGGCGAFASGPETRARFTDCTMRGARMHGLYVFDDACAAVENCSFASNEGCGGMVSGRGVLDLTTCCSKENKSGGFWAHGGCEMKLVDCSSTGDSWRGCGGERGAHVIGERVAVHCRSISPSSTSCCVFGFCFESGAKAELTICSVHDAAANGMNITGSTTKLNLIGCTLTGNTGSGVDVGEHACVAVDKCTFARNGGYGAVARTAGVLELSECSSEADGVASFCAKDKGCMKLVECISNDAVRDGCNVSSSGFVMGDRVTVHCAGRHAFSFEEGATGDLSGCTGSGAGVCGVVVAGELTSVQLSGFKVASNRAHGVSVLGQGRAVLEHCSFMRNGRCVLEL